MINEIVPFLLIFLIVIAGFTAFIGPQWLLWVSLIANLLLGITIGVVALGTPYGVLAGAVIGIVFALFIYGSGLLTRYYKKKGTERLKLAENVWNKTTSYEQYIRDLLLPGENISIVTPAKHLYKLDGVGGQLILTDQRLIFKPNPLHYRKYELSIPINHIIDVQPYNIYGVIRNGVKFDFNNKKPERFVTQKRLELINNVRKILV